jgi:hypothetical protein
MNAQQLIDALHAAFDYTQDNNRDLISDPTFPMEEVTEELKVGESYQFLIAYIHRNTDMINAQLSD